MGDKTNLQLKPIEGSALYRRRMLDEKYNTGIEESEELELNCLLNNLSQNVISKHEAPNLASRFPVLVNKSDVDNYEERKPHIVNDDNSR